MDNAQQHLQQLITKKTRRLQKLREQEAQRGYDTPPHILLEIEDLSDELQRLKTQLEQLQSGTLSENLALLLKIDPRILQVLPDSTSQQLTFTNLSGHAYRDVQIRLQSTWPVTLGKKKFALNDLLPDKPQTIEFPLKVTADPGQHFPLTVKIRVDDFRPYEFILRVLVKEPEKPKPLEPDPNPSLKIPPRSVLRRELRKLVVVEAQLLAFCDLPEFEALRDDIKDPLLSELKKVEKIMSFCITRNKEVELHQALKQILKSDYISDGSDK